MHQLTRSESPLSRWGMAGVVLLGLTVAVLTGVAIGERTPATLVPVVALVALTAAVLAMARPFAGFLVLAGSVVMLMLVLLPTGHGVNLFDLLLPPVLVGVWLGSERDAALRRERLDRGEAHDSIRLARRWLARSTIVFFSLAWVSVIPMLFDGRTAYAQDSIFSLLRSIQGLALFPLGLWLLRDAKRIRHTVNAMLCATVLLMIVNVAYEAIVDIQRAGMSWFVNNPYWPIADPNECAAGMLLILVLLMVRHAERPQWRNWLLAGPALAMLVMSQSRSGLLAFGVFGLFMLPRARWGWVITAAVVMAMLAPLVPHEYWVRVGNTLAFRRGTFETYTAMIRFMTWKTAANVFVHHPLFGVGYLGLESVSTAYNDMQVRVGAESYILEIAADLGIIGLAALTTVIASLIRLGRAVRRVAPAGSLGYQMAVINPALIVSLLAACLTGSNLIGFVGIGQLALWAAMLTCAGHEAVRTARVSGVGTAPA